MVPPINRTVIVPATDGKAYFGAYLGDNVEINSSSIKQEENKTGEKLDYILRFWSIPTMSGQFPQNEAEAAFQAGAALFIKEMPGNWGEHEPRLLPEIISQIKNKNGQYYNFYVSFAKAVAKWGVGTGKDKQDKPIFLSLGHEMNFSKDASYSYSWAGKPEEFKEYFSLAHDLILENGATNVTFVFNPNIGEEDSLQYFPQQCKLGKCVDIIGFDKYQKAKWSSWKSVPDLFMPDVERFKRLGLPMLIAEYGRNRSDVKENELVATIRGAIDYVTTPDNADGLFGLTYFDVDKGDGNWSLQGKNLEDFKAGMQNKKSLFEGGLFVEKRTLAGNVIVPANEIGTKKATAALPSLPTTNNSAPIKEKVPVASPRLPASRGFMPYPDPEIGTNNSSLPHLKSADIIKKISLEQIERILQAIVNQPANHVLSSEIAWRNAAELHQAFPELKAVIEIDQDYNNKFYWYFFNFSTYWDNVITLLSVYVQKCLEENQPKKNPNILIMIDTLRERIALQKTCDNASSNPTTYYPGDYSLAILNLSEAMVRSQIPGKNQAFYIKGIALANSAIARLMKPVSKEVPLAPDYFTIVTALQTLGDLNQQLFFLTDQKGFYDAAIAIYSNLAGIEEGKKGFSLNGKTITPRQINWAVDRNLAVGYIDEEAKQKALAGIFHYIKGAGLLKRAALNLSIPAKRSKADITNLLSEIKTGLENVFSAADVMGIDLKKNQFFTKLGTLLIGESLMKLADNIYKDDEKHGIDKPLLKYLAVLARSIAASLISDFSPQLGYLSIRAKVDLQKYQIESLAEKINQGEAHFEDAKNLLEDCLANEQILGAYGVYWDNVVALLTLLSQTAVQDRKTEEYLPLLAKAKELVEKFNTFKNEDKIIQIQKNPSNYSLAVLALMMGEISSQTENQSKEFYLEGIAYCQSGIRQMFALAHSQRRASQPDYFSIMRGIATEADLNQQLANLTYEEKYYQAAEALYQKVLAVADEKTIVFDPGDGTKNITPQIVAASLEKNIANGYLYPFDKHKARAGINHYLKGVALIKNASLFISWTKKKELADIYAQLTALNQGIKELEAASEETEVDLERNRFFITLATFLQAELLMAAVDRINIGFPKLSRISKNLFPPGTKIEAKNGSDLSKAELLEKVSQLAQEQFTAVSAIEKDNNGSYLYVLSQINLFSLAMRSAEYIIKIDKTGNRNDSLSMRNSIRVADVQPFLDKLAALQALYAQLPSSQRISYSSIELPFFKVLLLINGIPIKNKAGSIVVKDTKKRIIKHEYKIDLVTSILNSDLKADNLAQLPPAVQRYFGYHLSLKMATLKLQEAGLANKNGKKAEGTQKAIEALSMLRQAETLLGTPIPSHLRYQVSSLPSLLDKHDDDEVNVVLGSFIKFIKGRGLESYSGALSEIAFIQDNMHSSEARDRAVALYNNYCKSLENPQFGQDASLFAIDKHDFAANIYQEMAAAYSMLGEKYGTLKYEYAISTYYEADQSDLPYNQVVRHIYTMMQTQIDPAEYFNVFKIKYGLPSSGNPEFEK